MTKGTNSALLLLQNCKGFYKIHPIVVYDRIESSFSIELVNVIGE